MLCSLVSCLHGSNCGSGNRAHSPIPPELGNLATLRGLSLSANQLTGPIPPELGDLTNLQSLLLTANQVIGSIPPELGNLANLRSLWLDANQLTGPIPAELGSLANLQFLYLDRNELSGSIPTELGQLTNLRQGSGLDLRTNHLYTDNNSLREFLNSRQRSGGDWESFQTLYRYFAQFGDGEGFFSQIILFSLNDVAAATGQIELLGPSGDPLTVDLNGETVVGVHDVSVPATGLLSLRTRAEGDVQTGSVRVTTDRHVEGVVIFGGGFGLAGVGSSVKLEDGFRAPIQTRTVNGVTVLNTGIAVVNLSDESVTLTLTLRDADGFAIDVVEVVLPPNGQLADFVIEFDWPTDVVFDDFEGLLDGVATGPIAATVIQTRPNQFATMPVSPLSADLAAAANQRFEVETRQGANHPLYFAQFGDGLGQLFSQILLYNLGAEGATVQLLLKDDDGLPLTVDLNGEEVEGTTELELPASGFRMIETDGLGELAVGSVTVNSNQPVSGVIVFGGSVGLAGVGSSQILDAGFVAPIETNTQSGINTGVAMMNLEEESVTVDLALLSSDGEQIATAQVLLPALGHLSTFLDEVDTINWSQPVDFADFEGVLRATATGKTAATVIQTRPGQFATMPVAPKPAN